MILGMLSWTMATIQDYRSGLQKKRRRQAQRHLRMIANHIYMTMFLDVEHVSLVYNRAYQDSA